MNLPSDLPIPVPDPLFVNSADGTKIAVRDFGQSDSQGRLTSEEMPTLLFAHATGFHGLAYLPLIRMLRTEYRCLTLDMRGHGDSQEPLGGSYEWERFAEDIHSALGAFGVAGQSLPGVFGFGHSSGATALLLCEERFPGSFSGIYDYEPVMFPAAFDPETAKNAADRLVLAALRRRSTFASEDEALANFGSKPPMSRFDPESLYAYVHFGLRRTSGGGMALKCAPESEAKVYPGGGRHRAYEGLRSIGCPLRFACGDATDSFGADLMERWASESRNATSVTIKGTGHFGPMEVPGVIAGDLRSFLGRIPVQLPERSDGS